MMLDEFRKPKVALDDEARVLLSKMLTWNGIWIVLAMFFYVAESQPQ